MSDEPEPKQSFLSKLRQRSAIIFTIGLAISVASFVENLHMGKAAIAFAVDELSKIQGWEDIVRATAAIFHAALEWWRGVLRDLFSFLPFEVPQWLHDPISIASFGATRAWNQVQRDLTSLYRPSDALSDPARRQLLLTARRAFLPQRLAMSLMLIFSILIIPMSLLALSDPSTLSLSQAELAAQFQAYAVIFGIFAASIATAFYLGARRSSLGENALRELDVVEGTPGRRTHASIEPR